MANKPISKKTIRGILETYKLGKIACDNCKGIGLIQFENEGKILCPKCGGGEAMIEYSIDQVLQEFRQIIESKECFNQEVSEYYSGYNQALNELLEELE